MKRCLYSLIFALTLGLLIVVAGFKDVELNQDGNIASNISAVAQSTVKSTAENMANSPEFELKLPAYSTPTKLQIDSSRRFLVRADGSPFIWIGDTFWRFSLLTPQQHIQFLDDRQSKGYNLVMISVVTGIPEEPPGFKGNLQPIESHFQQLDRLIAEAQQRGMYVAIAVGWWHLVKDFDADALYNYGKFIGDRYKDRDNIIWLSAGEVGSHSRQTELAWERVQSLVRGLRDGDTGNKLLTLHADFQRGTSLTAMDSLTDFSNWQTGQSCCPDDLPRKDKRNWTVWQAIAHDYKRTTAKPTLDIEAWYENTNPLGGPIATPENIRRRAYFSIFAGGFGHSYGGDGIWDATANFSQALQLPGATQIGYLSQLLHSLGNDFLKLRPNQSMIVSGQSPDYNQHIQATSADDGSYALVYTAGTSNFALNLSQFNTESVSAIWFNPRTKNLSPKTSVYRGSQVNFTTPGQGDWVLLLGR